MRYFVQQILVVFLFYCCGNLAFAQETAACQTTARPEQPKTPAVLETLFANEKPEKYQVLQSGSICRESPKGVYVLMRHPEHHTMVLVVQAHDLQKSDPLRDKDLTRMAYHLFNQYVGFAQGYQITRKAQDRIRVGKHRAKVCTLQVTFADGFIEPDLIARLTLSRDRQLIILLGQPHVGGYQRPQDFSAAFAQMQQELRHLIAATTRH